MPRVKKTHYIYRMLDKRASSGTVIGNIYKHYKHKRVIYNKGPVLFPPKKANVQRTRIYSIVPINKQQY